MTWYDNLQYDHHTELGGVPSQYETYTLKTSCVVILVFHFQELMGLPSSFDCLVKFHSKLYLMLDYQQYMMH